MKKTLKAVLSIFLVLAMILPAVAAPVAVNGAQMAEETFVSFSADYANLADNSNLIVEFIPADGTFLFLPNMTATIGNEKYKKLIVAADKQYKTLTSGDVIYIDSNNKLVTDRNLIKKLIYINLVRDSIAVESQEISDLTERLSVSTKLVETLGNDYLEKTFGNAVVGNFKGIVSACLGNFSSWADSYIGLVKDFGIESVLYASIVAVMHDLLTDVSDSLQALVQYNKTMIDKAYNYGLTYDEAVEYETLFKNCFADIKTCDNYITLISNTFLNTNFSNSVAALDTMHIAGVKVTKDAIEKGFEELCGKTFIKSMQTAGDFYNLFQSIYSAIAVNDKREYYFDNHYVGKLDSEKPLLVTDDEVMRSVCKLTGKTESELNSSSSSSGYVTGTYKPTFTDGLNVRPGPSISSGSALTAIPYGYTFVVTKIENNWGYTTYNGKNGWVSLEYATSVTSSGSSNSAVSSATRDDGVWLFPVDKYYYNKFSDWCCCPGYDKCVICNVYHTSWGDSSHSSQKGHNGIDLATPSGTPVYASASGKYYTGGSNSHSRGYYVVIEHPVKNNLSYYSTYQHLSSFNSSLSNGQYVNAGDVIGYSGGSGYGSGVHLHFGIVIGNSGKGLAGPDTYELWGSSNPWVTKLEQTQGRIINNPKSNFPTASAGATLDAIISHKGTITYTFDKSKVSIGLVNSGTTVTPSVKLQSTTSKDKFTSEESVEISWNSYPNASSYGLTVTKKIGNTWGEKEVFCDKDGLTGNSYIINNLTPGEYRFNMGAYNQTGLLISDYSDLTYFTVVSVSSGGDSDPNDIYPYSASYKNSKFYTALENVTMTADDATNIVNVAMSQIGYHEGNSTSDLNGLNSGGNGNYSEYGYWFGTQVKGQTGGHFADWCAMFVSWCARMAGISTSVISNAAYAKASESAYCFKNISYFERDNATPRIGDLIFFDNPNISGEWDHVGIVKSVTSTQIVTIEGNAGEMVQMKTYQLDDSYIQGYGRPSYEMVENDTSKPSGWSEWSEWKEVPINETSFRKVETKTLYGYYHYVHTWTDTGFTGAYPVENSALFTQDKSDIVEYHDFWNETKLTQIDSWTYGGVTYKAYENLHKCLVGSNQSKVNNLFDLNKTKTLYRYSEAFFTISYDANGGSGAPTEQTKLYNSNLSLSSIVPTKSGYTFVGWSTSKNGAVEYIPGDNYLNNLDATLYAVWQLDTVSVTGVTLNKTSLTLDIGATQTLTATVTPTNATNKNVTWTSSNTSVATVSNGVVTAKSAGTATITVTTTDGNKTATCQVTVKTPVVNVTSVSLNKSTLTLDVGATEALTATVNPTNATNKNVTWTSSNTSVATVSNGVVTAKAAGTATITVTTTDGNKTATCTVTVNAPADEPGDEPAVKLNISAEKVTASAGKEVTVDINITDNPGFAGLTLTVLYDSNILEFIDTIPGILADAVVGDKTGKVIFTYAGVKNINGDGALASIQFKVKEDAPEGVYPVTLSFVKGDAFRYEGRTEIDCGANLTNGEVKVIEYKPGDANGDDVINNRDAARVLQHIAQWDVEINLDAADANGDGTVNNRDAARILQYIAGWEVTLG